MIRIYYFSFLFLITLLLASPFLDFRITGLDTIGFSSGGDNELITAPGGGIGASQSDNEQETVTVPSGGSGGGGSSSGGSGGGGLLKILVIPSEINEELITNTNKEITLTVESNETFFRNLTVSQTNLDRMIILEKNFLEIGSKEIKTFKIILVALNETGLFTGKIRFGGIEVPISLNIRSQLLLFDSSIKVLNVLSKVRQGAPLRTEISLIPKGDDERLDITLNYIIKDFDGKIYFTASETLLIEDEKKIKREFETGNLPLGKYVIGLELVYPNGVAPSSDTFEVTDRINLGVILYYVITAILINSILVVLVLLSNTTKSEEEYYASYG